MTILDDEHEMSECAEKATNFFWPASLTVGHPLFERRMIELQISLIKCYQCIMPPSDLQRSHRTLQYLHRRLKEESSAQQATSDTEHTDLYPALLV